MAITQPAVGTTYKDIEIPTFYAIEIPVVSLVLIISLFGGDPTANVIMLIILLGFLYFGWPIKAIVTPQGDIIFRSPLRIYKITPDNLKSVKLGGLKDSRVQVILRTKRRYSIGYRIRKYSNASDLAKAVLDLVNRSSNATVSDDAIKLLRQVSAKVHI